jgi:RES domain-containing protein
MWRSALPDHGRRRSVSATGTGPHGPVPVALTERLRPWSGNALRHIPAGSPLGPLDFRYTGTGPESRWNEPGTPTLYLAGDEGVLIAEWGHHFATNRTPELQRQTRERAVYRFLLVLDAVIDLRDPAVWDGISLAGAPHCFLDIAVARATATFVRRTTPAQGLLVPSVCFLDRLDRWCLVLFLEKLPEPSRWITAVTATGPLRWGTLADAAREPVTAPAPPRNGSPGSAKNVLPWLGAPRSIRWGR